MSPPPDKKSLSERDICTKYITPAIVQGGWDVQTQVRENVHLTKGRAIVRGRLVTRGIAKLRRAEDRAAGLVESRRPRVGGVTKIGGEQMAAEIKLSELTPHDPVEIKFAFSGLREKHAQKIMRDIIRDGWPGQKRPKQSVYAIRLAGEVAVAYKRSFSPVTYIGEGNAFDRVYKHTNWLVPLLLSVPQLSLEVRIVEVARKNHLSLYQNVEADLLRWFSDDHGGVPWFNRQGEPSKHDCYDYHPEAVKELKKMISIGSGNTFRWAIQPTRNNDHYHHYTKGMASDA